MLGFGVNLNLTEVWLQKEEPADERGEEIKEEQPAAPRASPEQLDGAELAAAERVGGEPRVEAEPAPATAKFIAIVEAEDDTEIVAESDDEDGDELNIGNQRIPLSNLLESLKQQKGGKVQSKLPSWDSAGVTTASKSVASTSGFSSRIQRNRFRAATKKGVIEPMRKSHGPLTQPRSGSPLVGQAGQPPSQEIEKLGVASNVNLQAASSLEGVSESQEEQLTVQHPFMSMEHIQHEEPAQ